jgi:cyanophycinase-like exopeptidase
VTVTPHVRPGAARIGEDEMTDSVHTWIAKHPGTVAINIAEHTVLVLHGGTVEVLGTGSVSIFGALADPQATIHLKAGTTRDMRTPQG